MSEYTTRKAVERAKTYGRQVAETVVVSAVFCLGIALGAWMRACWMQGPCR